jgi:hypothetical protein
MKATTLALAGSLLASGAFAQAPAVRDPNMPALQNTIPEKIEPRAEGDPPATGSTDGTLSDRLNRSDGVIRPDMSATPNMSVPAPVPNPGTTPVITPPEVRSGGDVQAK